MASVNKSLLFIFLALGGLISPVEATTKTITITDPCGYEPVTVTDYVTIDPGCYPETVTDTITETTTETEPCPYPVTVTETETETETSTKIKYKWKTKWKTSTVTDTATESYTETATESYTETATESYTETATESYTETATESYTDTATESYTDTATETATESTTATETTATTETTVTTETSLTTVVSSYTSSYTTTIVSSYTTTISGAVTTVTTTITTTRSTTIPVTTTRTNTRTLPVVTAPGATRTVTRTATVTAPGSVIYQQICEKRYPAAGDLTSMDYPGDYTWGCAPGKLCVPKTRRRQGRGACPNEPPPSDVYACKPEECIPAPPLCQTQYCGEPIYSNETCKYYFNNYPYYNLDVRRWALDFSVFGGSVFPSNYALDRRQSLIAQSSTTMARTVSPCYDDCNAPLLEAQRTGKVPALCSLDSSFNSKLQGCSKCMERLDPSRTLFAQLAYPDVAQFVSYCQGYAPAPLMQTTPVAKGLDSGQTSSQGLSTGVIEKETVTVTQMAQSVTTSDEPAPTEEPTTAEEPTSTEEPTTTAEETSTTEEPTETITYESTVTLPTETSSPPETIPTETEAPIPTYMPTGAPGASSSSGLYPYPPSGTSTGLPAPPAASSAGRNARPSMTALMVIIGYFLFMYL